MVLNHYHINHKTITIYALDSKNAELVNCCESMVYGWYPKFAAMCLSVNAVCLSVRNR